MADEGTANATLTPEKVAEIASQAAAAAVSAAMAPLVERLNAAPPAAPAQPTEQQTFTVAQLDEAVQAGRITEVQKQDILERQREAMVAENARKAARDEIQAAQIMQTVEQGISAYAELVPDVVKEGTVARDRVKKQYDNLVALGQPRSKATQLVALQMTYGSIEALRAARSGEAPAHTHEDVGSGAGRAQGTTAPGKDGPKTKLTADERQYYEDQIQRGVYRDWAAVDEVMKFASPKTRARHGASVH